MDDSPFIINNMIKQTFLGAAPLLRGLKPSNLLGVVFDCGQFNNWLAQLPPDIAAYPLYMIKQKLYLLLYRPKHLSQTLDNGPARAFLKTLGYDNNKSIEQKLFTLKKRFFEYINSRSGYPHEVGIFLGYPPRDVRDFITYKGKGYLISGYWKVYNNPDKAGRIFKLYDKARELAKRAYKSGMKLKDFGSFKDKD